ncbi:MAG: bacterial transcriptional activator domain-containing protein [Thiotrichaceae bacterium]
MGLNIISSESSIRTSALYHARAFAYLPGQTVRVHTLGRFSIQIDGQPLLAARLRQQKPLELLQVLIAFGGRDVSADLISSSLWPDADGDDAANAFDVTLHRARRILGYKDAIIANGGRYSINNDRVWVDAWVFERLLNQVDRALMLSKGKAVSRRVEQLLNRALMLYQGAFLSREQIKPWNLSLRERLRSKLLRSILEVGRIAENNSHWYSAIPLYNKGLEIETFAETLYQRLMICYRQSGHKAEALAVYQRCRSNLSNGLCIAPSQETEKIRTSLY